MPLYFFKEICVTVDQKLFHPKTLRAAPCIGTFLWHGLFHLIGA